MSKECGKVEDQAKGKRLKNGALTIKSAGQLTATTTSARARKPGLNDGFTSADRRMAG